MPSHSGPILITGGSKGLGRAMAEALAARGASVYASSRSGPPLGRAAAPGEILPVGLDVRSEESVLELFGAFDRLAVRLQVLVNNAGVGTFKPITETTADELRAMVDTNLVGAFLCAKEAFSRMKAGGGGRIINIGSICDHVAIVDNAGYAASKFGLRGLSQVLAEEGKAHGIRVSLVSPGAVYSDIWSGRVGFEKEDMLSAEDVAATIVDIVERPAHVRIDQVTILPPKGVL